MPLGKSVSKNMKEITDAHPDWTRKRRVSASLNAAREHGYKVRRKGNGKRTKKRGRR